MAVKKNEQQILNNRARAIGHRIENLKTVGHYKIYEIKTGAYYIVTKHIELCSLINNLEAQAGNK